MSDTQKSENCISGFSILRATMMAVLFPAVLVYYYDAVFWKPYFYGPWNTPTLWSFLAMAAGGLAAAVHRFLRRRKGRPLPRPGIEEIATPVLRIDWDDSREAGAPAGAAPRD